MGHKIVRHFELVQDNNRGRMYLDISVDDVTCSFHAAYHAYSDQYSNRFYWSEGLFTCPRVQRLWLGVAELKPICLSNA